jgi:MFS transporter, DHA1 family, multidrug resistance protein
MFGGDRGHFALFFAVFYAARAAVSLVIPLYFASVGISLIGVGVAIGIFGASLLVFEILWGFLFDRVGPGPLILLSVVSASGMYILIPLVKTTEAAVLAEFLLGASSPIVTVVLRSRIARESTSEGSAKGFGILGSLFAISQLMGTLLGSVGALSIGFADSFYLSAGLTLAAYPVYLRSSRSTPMNDGPGPKADLSSHPSGAPTSGFDRASILLLSLIAVPTFVGYAFFTNIIQLVVTHSSRFSGSGFDAGLVVSAFWLSSSFFQPLVTVKGRSRARTWVAVALLANFGLFASMVSLNGVWELAGAALAEGACFSVISPLSLSLLVASIPNRYAGRMMGIYGAVEDIGLIIGPLAGSAVWVGYGLDPAFLVLGAPFLVVFVPYALHLRSSMKSEVSDG